MPFSITKKEKMTESMTDYLDQINKKVSRIQVMAVGNLEKQIEDKRAQKLRDKEQEKQTKALQEIAKLLREGAFGGGGSGSGSGGKDGKKSSGFFGSLFNLAWKGLAAAYFGGKIAAALTRSAINVGKNAHQAVKKQAVKWENRQAVRNMQQVKARKAPKIPVIEKFTKTNIVNTSQGKATKLRITPQARVTPFQKVFTSTRTPIADIGPTRRTVPTRVKFPGTTPIKITPKTNIVDLDAKARNVATAGEKRFASKTGTKLAKAAKNAEKLSKLGKAAGKLTGKAIALLGAPIIWADYYWEQRTGNRSNWFAAALGDVPLFESNVAKPNLKNPGEQATDESAAFIFDYAWMSNLWHSGALPFTTKTDTSAGGVAEALKIGPAGMTMRDLGDANNTGNKKELSAKMVKEARGNVADYFTKSRKAFGDLANDAAEKTKEGLSSITKWFISVGDEIGNVTEQAEKTSTKIKKKVTGFDYKKLMNVMRFGSATGKGSERIRSNVETMIALDPAMAKMLHISGSAFAAQGFNQRVTSGFRNKEAQRRAMENQRIKNPAQYKKNYGTPTETSTDEWMSRKMSKHQHGRAVDIAYPAEIRGNEIKEHAFVDSINENLIASGLKPTAVHEIDHIHMGLGATPTRKEAALYELAFNAKQQELFGTRNNRGNVLQDANKRNQELNQNGSTPNVIITTQDQSTNINGGGGGAPVLAPQMRPRNIMTSNA